MNIEDQYLDSDSDIFLAPASNAQAKNNLDKTVREGGIKFEDLKNEISTQLVENVEKLEEEIKNDRLEHEHKEEELEDIHDTISELNDQLEIIKRTPDSRGQGENVTFEKQAQIEGLHDEIKYKKEEEKELRSYLKNLEQTLESKQQELDSKKAKLEKEEKQFESVRNALPDQSQIPLWGIRRNNADKWDIEKGDVILYYTGDYRYSYAGIVRESLSEPEFNDRVFQTDNDDVFELLVIFDDAFEIKIDSAVVAEYADHDIDYVFGFTRINKKGLTRIRELHGSISKFLLEAGEKGIQEPRESTAEVATDEDPKAINEGVEDQKIDSGASNTSQGSVSLDSLKSINEPLEDIQSTPAAINDQNSLRNSAVVVSQLARERQLLIHGPPRTGKIPAIRDFAHEWLDNENSKIPIEDRIRTVSFHESLSQEEFIVGKASNGSSPGIVRGPFGKFCELAAADTKQAELNERSELPKYVLIIDNFHRANPANIFGEIWPLLASDARGEKHAITHSDTRTPIWIPDKLYIIAVVDTSEMATEKLPSAIRERFRFLHVPPNFDTVRKEYGYSDREDLISKGKDEFSATSILALEKINKLIRDTDNIGTGKQLGHYFLSADTIRVTAYDPYELRNAWIHDILPHLATYFENGLSELYSTLLKDYDTSNLDEEGLPATDETAHAIVDLVKDLAIE